MSPVKEMTRVAGLVPAEVADDLQALADENDRSLAAELRRAIRIYVNHERGRADAEEDAA